MAGFLSKLSPTSLEPMVRIEISIENNLAELVTSIGRLVLLLLFIIKATVVPNKRDSSVILFL